jgi:SAM-dependent methyltransferase
MNNNRTRVIKISIALISFSFLILTNVPAVGQRPQKPPEVPYVPTPEKVVEEMLRIADVNKDDILYDLGCGDGRIVITAATKFGCTGIGIDIDPQRIKESKENAAEAGVEDKVEFLLMDLFEADIKKASVVTLYLLSRVNLRLRPTLLRDLKPGTRVVSHDFTMDDWEPEERLVIDAETPVYDNFYTESYWDRHSVYFWIIPANVTGTWEWKMAAGAEKKDYSLQLEQTFQKIEGKAQEDAFLIPLTIKDGKIMGDKLEFTLERRVKGKKEQLLFTGIVSGHYIVGKMTIDGRSGSKENWRARRIPSTYKSIAK